MTVSFVLNGKNESCDVPANKRLVDVLREEFQLLNGRAGCYAGTCGTCGVLIDDELVHACLVPIFAAQDSEIVTFEGLIDSPELGEIVDGLKSASALPCGNCIQSKTLTIHALLAANPLPRRDDIVKAIGWQRCSCTDIEALCNAVERIANMRRFRRHAGR